LELRPWLFTSVTIPSCHILMRLESYRQMLVKYSNIKFHEIPSFRTQVVTCGQTWRS